MVSHFRIKWLNVMSAIDYSHYDGEQLVSRARKLLDNTAAIQSWKSHINVVNAPSVISSAATSGDACPVLHCSCTCRPMTDARFHKYEPHRARVRHTSVPATESVDKKERNRYYVRYKISRAVYA
ncbi:hypothetical protein ALC53_08197 [Atta colombica]|uniref:Uncharacterized protein n=1 Tax=Atta colombica TaxID=520822 RepID=A0A195BB61_9HYME|nr:hypothetical protein ALC53_08197 [Atta colombica]